MQSARRPSRRDEDPPVTDDREGFGRPEVLRHLEGEVEAVSLSRCPLEQLDPPGTALTDGEGLARDVDGPNALEAALRIAEGPQGIARSGRDTELLHRVPPHATRGDQHDLIIVGSADPDVDRDAEFTPRIARRSVPWRLLVADARDLPPEEREAAHTRGGAIDDPEPMVVVDVEALEQQALSEMKAFRDRCPAGGNKIAAILIEPMQCEGGDRTFRPEFLQALRDFAHESECLLIFDEVQTGFFGSGKPWYWQHSGATPDLVAFGKKSQVCGMYAGPRLDEVEDNVFRKSSRISSTWGGGLTDMVRSRRFIELIVEHGYCQNAHERGEQIKAGLRRIAKDTNKFTSVRGEGTLLAFDFANGEQRGDMLKKLYDHKVLGLPCGDKTVRLRTPLSMEAGEADEVLNRIEAAAGAVDSGSCCGCC